MKKDVTGLISIAGIFHDIGKFAERAGDVAYANKDLVHQNYRYAHAYHTEKVLENFFADRAIWSPHGFRDLTVINLASRHHNPRSVYELLIAEGDRIASGHECMKADEAAEYDVGGYERKSKVPLINILSRVRLEGRPDQGIDEDWRYRLRTFSSVFTEEGFSDIFPCKGSEYQAQDVQGDYAKHWEDFKSAIAVSVNGRKLDLFDNFETIYEICRDYMWCLPASTRKEELPDVSLFEHSKATAALASCLYLYHADENGIIKESDRSKKEIADRSIDKFLLFAGDISGIQKFVYQISSKGAYKTLKGRSFVIQLLCEILSRSFVEEFGLTLSNVLYACGGKFYLLLPNTGDVRSELSELDYRLNRWLFKEFAGDLYVRTAFEALSGDDLTRQSGETLYDKWDYLSRKLVYGDRKRYRDLMFNDYDLIFGTEQVKPNTCEVCHSSISEGNRCSTCLRMEELGRRLGLATYIAFAQDSQAFEREVHVFSVNKVFSKDTFVWIFSEDNLADTVASNVTIFSINRGKIEKIPLAFPHHERVNASLMILGSNHRFDRDFERIAEKSEGVQRLGILRMDVDDLGKVFSQGLKKYKHAEYADERFYSLGRITTLSFQLSLFFGGIVPQIIRSDKSLAERVTVVYSGGDDLFLLGAWDAIPDSAGKIKRLFDIFTCHNPSFSLSGGIVITRGKFPIYKSAEMAGEAEARAKKNSYQYASRRSGEKNSLTFLDVIMSWEEYEEISRMYQRMLKTFLNKKYNPLLVRLREVSYLYEKEKFLSKNRTNYSMEQIRKKLMAEKWRWRMIYSLARFSEQYPELTAEIDWLRKFAVSQMESTKKCGIEFLPLLTRWWEIRTRGEKKKEVHDGKSPQE